MKRAALLLFAILLLPGGPAVARATNPAPHAEITLTQLTQSTPRRPAEVLIQVEAADPNALITELMIDFGDGAVVWLLLACDPKSPAGTPVKQELTWSYAPGVYEVHAVAYSVTHCSRGAYQQSAPAVATIVVT